MVCATQVELPVLRSAKLARRSAKTARTRALASSEAGATSGARPWQASRSGREVANEPRPQRPDTDPCARSKLEVLGDPTVEDKAPVEIRRIDLAQRIAE